MNWTEKYRPRSLVDVVGNEEAKERLVNYLRNWDKYPKHGILLYGPAGVGKTASVYAAANDLGYHVIELNASDVRSADRIQKAVGGLSRGRTLDAYFWGRAMRPLVFFDEIDGLDPREDTGGLSAVLEIASKKEFPVVAAANFIDPVRHKQLLQSFEVVEFRSLTPRQIIVVLSRIVREEGLSVGREDLVKIAERARGDARMAINMLYSLSMGGDVEALANPMENLPINMLLQRISSSISLQEIRALIEANPQHWKDVLYTYFDIIARSPVMKDDRRLSLLGVVSLVDTMIGRMERERMYFYMRYIPHLLSWIVYQANKWGAVYDGRIPEYRFYLFVSNRAVREELDALLEELGRRLHESRRKFLVGTLAPAALLHRNQFKKLYEWVSRSFGLRV